MIIALKVNCKESTCFHLLVALLSPTSKLSAVMLQNMFPKEICFIFLVVIVHNGLVSGNLMTKNFDCGPNGFICEGNNKLRLCEGENLLGPAFLCPPNTRCNEDSSDVCENNINYIDPAITKNMRCHRHERIADPYVPGCKGYILCIPNKYRFQGIKFKCAGNTIFNGLTRTCSSPDSYKCPLANTTKQSALELFVEENRKMDSKPSHNVNLDTRIKPLECKNYKFSTDDNGPVRAAYFCPPRPVYGENAVRCTIFSSKFCLTLERVDEDQFARNAGFAYRKPRK